MRRVPIEYVHDGNFLGKSLYTETGILLIAKGVKLTHETIAKIHSFGYVNLFIQDEYTEQDIEEVIKPQVRAKITSINKSMANSLKDVMVPKTNSKRITNIGNQASEMIGTIDEIITDLLTCKDFAVNLASVSVYDDFTYNHSLNVMVLSTIIGNKMGLGMDKIKNLAHGTIFHDIGKILIPKDILLKPGKLTDNEYQQVQTHALRGFDFLRDYTDLRATTRITSLDHHERWDGDGYPNGKKGEEIHLFGRICAVCDVFEALIADRPYRRGVYIQDAREMILGGGNSHFDMDVVHAFNLALNPFPLDTKVKLSNGFEGVVVKINGENYSRPVVRVHCEEGRKVNAVDMDLTIILNVVISGLIHEFAFEAVTVSEA